MPVLGVIPARLGSTRLVRKPLQLLGGEPLIVRVLTRMLEIEIADVVIVATDSPEIQAVVHRAGGRALMTAPFHESGTERVAEIARRPEFAGYDVVLNVQGDEPFLPGAAAAGAVARVRAGDDVGTAAVPLDEADADDPSRVKVVTDHGGRALYFSRAKIPFRRDPQAPADGQYWQHLGVYAYAPPALERWVRAPATRLERLEGLEQLRALYLGLTIGVARLREPASGGIDTPDDLARAEQQWHASATGEETR
jgi:3-deoxy-manno-octulosonate cytidylyltransferase (CMP-KDO synthetase)